MDDPSGSGRSAQSLIRKRLHQQDDNEAKRRNCEPSSALNSDLLSDDSRARASALSSESVYYFHVPSSPPMDPMAQHMDSSPGRNEFMTSQATVVPIYPDSDDSDSTVDFNVTSLNKIKGYISSDFEPTVNEDSSIRAKGVIAQCIEDGNPQLHLENFGLKTLPDDVEDMKNMVCWGISGVIIPRIEVYATNNQLRILPPCLFNVEHLSVLSLRGNRLRKLPGILWKLKNLTDLSLGANEIRVLPHQILSLQKLENLLIRPNPLLIELKDQDPSTVFQMVSNPQARDIRRYVSRIKWISIPPRLSNLADRVIAREISPVPTLRELALRKFSHYDATLSETTLWKRTIPVYTQRMITKAMQKGIYDESCSVCGLITVNPVAKVLEWWDFRSQSLVPIRRNFCCGNCVNQWLDELERTPPDT